MSAKKSYLIVLLFVLIAVNWFFVFAPISQVNSLFKKAPTAINNVINQSFPQDLKIEVKNGKVNINRKTPYCLLIETTPPTGIIFDPLFEKDLGSFVSPEYLKLCQPIAVVGKGLIAVPGQSGNVDIQIIPESTNYVITQDKLKKISADNIERYASTAKTLYYVAPVIIIPFVLLFFMSLNVWHTLVAKFGSTIFRFRGSISYKEAFKISLYGFVTWQIIDSIFIKLILSQIVGSPIILSFPLSSTVFVFITNLIYMMTLFQEKEEKTPHFSSTPITTAPPPPITNPGVVNTTQAPAPIPEKIIKVDEVNFDTSTISQPEITIPKQNPTVQTTSPNNDPPAMTMPE